MTNTSSWADTGFYDGNSVPQRTGAEGAIPAFVNAADAFIAEGAVASPVVIANFGCTGGTNGLEPITAAIERIRATGCGYPVVVAQVDLPGNDFSALFDTVDNHPRSYSRLGEVYTAAVGKSLFQRALPPESLALGWCTHSMHWVSQAPEDTTVEGHVSVCMASRAAQAPWADVAARDWRDFLTNRAAELRRGGRVLLEFCIQDAAGHFGAEPMYRVADRAFDAMVERSLMTAEQAATTVVPIYCRTEEEVRAPFASGPLADLLSLEAINVRDLHDPFFSDYRRSGDAATFARNWASTLRGFTEEVFFGADTQVADAYYAIVAALVEEDPTAATNDWHIADVVFSRR